MAILFLILAINHDESFKYNLVGAESFQQMEGNWVLEKCIGGGVDRTVEVPVGADEECTVTNYEFNQKLDGESQEIWKCVDFDSDFNAFKIVNTKGFAGLVTIKKDKLIMVVRSLKTGKTPTQFKPCKGNNYFVFVKQE